MQLNAEDGGNRKYILVQLPEPIDAKKSKAAYEFVTKELNAEPTIFEITRERLKRAAARTQADIDAQVEAKEAELKALDGELSLDGNEAQHKKLQTEIAALRGQDLGFRVFETLPIWDDYTFEADHFDANLTLFDVAKLDADDLTALRTTWKTADGIPLTEAPKPVELAGYRAYYGGQKLYLMDRGFTTDGLVKLLERIDTDRAFNPNTVVAFGYHFDSKHLIELAGNLKTYANKKNIDIDFVTRY